MQDINDDVKDRLVSSLHSSLMDMDAHYYNDYKYDDERIIYLTVGDIKYLYEFFTGENYW